MKRYIGSKMTAFAAIILPCFIFLPFVFSAIVLISEISISTIVLSIGCILCSVIWFLYIKQTFNQLYTWGKFLKNEILIKTIFSKEYKIEYIKCKSVKLSYYTHSAIGGRIGKRIWFICFSYECIDDKYMTKINLWKPSFNGIKVAFDMQLYSYLLNVLPAKQRASLQIEYETKIKTEK